MVDRSKPNIPTTEQWAMEIEAMNDTMRKSIIDRCRTFVASKEEEVAKLRALLDIGTTSSLAQLDLRRHYEES